MTSLSTHVLDTTHGRPAAGVALRLLSKGEDVQVYQGFTDRDGRCPGLPAIAPGRYALAFAVGDYFRALGTPLPEPPFLDVVTIDFGVAQGGEHYHVPLLVSPFGYSTYRGS